LLSWPLAASAELELRRRRAAAVGPVIEPFADWLPLVSPTWQWDVPHLRLVQQALARLTAGETGKLMLFLPPRHGKSELVTIRYPVWRLEREPATRVIVGAYNQGLAERFSRRARRIAADRLRLSDERATAADWETTAGGGVRAVGVGSGVTGTGANLIIIDDPVKSREEANSPAYRERVWDWYTDDLYTRREPGAAMLLIQTRWHKDDLAGRILASEDGPNWTVLSLPAEAEADDPLGRALGEPLWPERFDSGALAGIRTVLGSWSYAALYQQRPMPAEGGMFQRQWFRVVERAPGGLSWTRYWDLAASTKTGGDYTASAAVALADDGTLYIRDMIRGRWEWPDAKRVLMTTMLSDVSVAHGIEEALHGLAAVQELSREPSRVNCTVRGIGVDKDKFSRALPWAARAERGQVALVRGSWIEEFLAEVTAFPLGVHDDQVDTVSGGVQMLGRSHTGGIFV
jgi:predicted phage terminase large subunit-like protein